MLFAFTTMLGSALMVLAAMAERLSRYTLVLDTLLRGIGQASNFVPVVRVGPGEIVFMLTSLVGCMATVWRVPERFEVASGAPQGPAIGPSPEASFVETYFPQ
jgi:hypothetical protein